MGLKLNPEDSILVIIDVQTAFLPHLYQANETVSALEILAKGANLLGLPIIVTEQSPEKLGPTAENLLKAAGEGPEVFRFSKSSFSAAELPEFQNLLTRLNRSRIILCGIESHICVNQTAMRLMETGRRVYLAEDAITSRTQQNRDIGLRKLAQQGAVTGSVESILFELLGDANHPAFRDIQKLIK